MPETTAERVARLKGQGETTAQRVARLKSAPVAQAATAAPDPAYDAMQQAEFRRLDAQDELDMNRSEWRAQSITDSGVDPSPVKQTTLDVDRQVRINEGRPKRNAEWYARHLYNEKLQDTPEAAQAMLDRADKDVREEAYGSAQTRADRVFRAATPFDDAAQVIEHGNQRIENLSPEGVLKQLARERQAQTDSPLARLGTDMAPSLPQLLLPGVGTVKGMAVMGAAGDPENPLRGAARGAAFAGLGGVAGKLAEKPLSRLPVAVRAPLAQAATGAPVGGAISAAFGDEYGGEQALGDTLMGGVLGARGVRARARAEAFGKGRAKVAAERARTAQEASEAQGAQAAPPPDQAAQAAPLPDLTPAEAGQAIVDRLQSHPEEAVDLVSPETVDALSAARTPQEAVQALQDRPQGVREDGTNSFGYDPAAQNVEGGAKPLVEAAKAEGYQTVSSGEASKITGKPWVTAVAPDGRTVTLEPGPDGAPQERGSQSESLPAEAPPAAEAPAPRGTSIKNAVVNEERAARGLGPLEDTPAQSFKGWADEAARRMAENPREPIKVMDDLKRTGRAHMPVEVAILTRHRVNLNTSLKIAQAEVIKAAERGDLDAVASAKAEADKVRAEDFEASELVGKAAGAEAARGLGSRKMMMDDAYELLPMETQRRVANDGKPLTEAQAAETKALHDRLKAVEAREDRVAEIEAKQALGPVRPSTDRRGYGKSNKIVTRETYESLLAEMRTTLSAGVDIVKLAKIGAFHIEAGARGFARWSQKMLKALPKVGPHLKAIWVESNKQVPALDAETGKAEAGKIAEMVMHAGVKSRDAVLDEVHAILKETNPSITRREVMDAISGYGQVRKLNADPIKAELRELKGQMQQLAKLEDMAAGRAPLKTGVERQAPGDEQRRLIKEVGEAKREGGYDVRDPAAQLKSALDATKTRLTNEIADLDKQIAGGKRAIWRRKSVALDAEATALKARRDALNDVLDALDPAAKRGLTDEQRINNSIKAIERATVEYERRISTGDLLPTKKVDAAFEARKRKALVNAEAQRDTIKQEWQEALVKDQLKNQSIAMKAARIAFVDAPSLLRVIKLTFDFSLAGLQGGARMVMHPTQWAKAMSDGFKAFSSPKAKARAETRMKLDPAYGEARQGKTAFGGHGTMKIEEMLRSRWADKIPVIRNFQRFGQTFVNRLRLESHKAAGATLSRTGTMTPAESKVIGNFVNAFTGRGGGESQSLDVLNNAFLAPRWVISRFQVILAPLTGFRYGKGATARTRKYIAGEYLRLLRGVGIVYGLVAVAGGKIDTDEDSPSFGMIKFGNTSIDPLFGLVTAAKFLYRSGIAIFGDEDDRRGQAKDFVEKYARGKLTPILGAFVSRAHGTTIGREEATWGTLAKEVAVPLVIQDITKVAKEHGPIEGSALAALSMFGVRVNIFRKQKGKKSR